MSNLYSNVKRESLQSILIRAETRQPFLECCQAVFKKGLTWRSVPAYHKHPQIHMGRL